MKLRVGLVGLGEAWESRHRPALRALGDRFEVRAVCAEVAVQAEKAAVEFGATPTDGFRALAARPDVDAVLVLTPQWYGPLPILAACEAGKAVYWAGAMDLEPQQARQIKQRVEEAGIAFMAEFPRRHAPATLRLKELIATRLGVPRLMFCHHRMSLSSTNGTLAHKCQSHRVKRELMELVDWCHYIAGREPSSVVGITLKAQGGQEVEPYHMMSVDFSPPGTVGSGPIAQISCSNYLTRNWPEAITFRPPAGMQVCCQHGVAFVDLPATLVWFDDAGRHLESLETERPVGEQLLGHFHRAVTSLVRKTSDLEDAYRSIVVCLGADASMREGRRVWLEF